jgi:hypothetical protein
MTVEHLPEPPVDLVDSVGLTDDSGRSGAERIAIAIETISTVDESTLDLDDSSHLELLCVGGGY